MEICRDLSTWHSILVHISTAFLFLSFGLDLYGHFMRNESALRCGRLALIFGTVGLFSGFVTGNFAEIWMVRSLAPQDPIVRHRACATVCSWLLLALVTYRITLSVRSKLKKSLPYLIAGSLVFFCLSLTFAQGYDLVLELQTTKLGGVGIPHRATGLELANLSLEATTDAMEYSEYMHHFFGWLVLALAIWATYQTLGLPGAERLRGIGPLLLVAHGLFLMIFSDFDGWPLASFKSITDPEVLTHKSIALLMIVTGVGANLVRRRKDSDISSLQAYLVAILALGGGSILFLQRYTGAPYSETAMGVYLYHLILGFLALICGAVKLLELSRPQRTQGWNLVWILLLLVVSAALLTYNEGIPWFMPSIS